MRIVTLIENTTKNSELKNEHGLSFFIETDKHRILFDTGASGKFLDNAEKLNIDLEQVDIAIISHGHYDHGGGIGGFLRLNSNAEIYFSKDAFGDYYTKGKEGMKYIGLDRELFPNSRFRFVEDYLRIDDELEVYSNIEGSPNPAESNKNLFMKEEDTYLPDSFNHEQNLLIHNKDKRILIAGCAHRGMSNIIEHVLKKNPKIDYVFGGLHLYSHATQKSEDQEHLREIGHNLKETGITFYTGHCTGNEAFQTLRSILKDKMNYMYTGREIIL